MFVVLIFYVTLQHNLRLGKVLGYIYLGGYYG